MEERKEGQAISLVLMRNALLVPSFCHANLVPRVFSAFQDGGREIKGIWSNWQDATKDARDVFALCKFFFALCFVSTPSFSTLGFSFCIVMLFSRVLYGILIGFPFVN